MSRPLEIIPAGYGLPECVQLCAPVSVGARSWRILAAVGAPETAPALCLQPLDDPASWREVRWGDYYDAVRSQGVFSATKPAEPTPASEVTLRSNGGFVRASFAAVVEFLLRPQEAP